MLSVDLLCLPGGHQVTDSDLKPAGAVATETRSVSGSELALLFYGSLSFIFLNLGPQLYLVEILAFAVVVHAALSKPKMSRLYWAVFATWALWLLGTVLSDLYNPTSTLDATKGFARVVVLGVLIYALAYLVGRDIRRALFLWTGICLSLVLSTQLLPNGYFAGEPWKFGFAIPVTLGIFILASSRLRKLAAPLAATMALVHFLAGSRSLAIVCAITVLILLLQSESKSSRGRLLVVGVVGLGMLIGLVAIYDSLSAGGFFGYERQVRASYQAAGQLGSFLTGRGEFLFSLQSIAEKPLLGVGSYGQPSSEVLNAQVSYLASEGYATVARDYLRDGIASFHSELLGSVAENGILALPFWVVIVFIFARGIGAVLTRRAELAPLVAFLSVLGLWDALFSPLGADRKFWVAASVVTVIALTAPWKVKDDSVNSHY